MSEPQQILDYASPGRGGQFRVGSESVIRVVEETGGGVTILEYLENRAVAAILIGVDLLLIALMVAGLAPQWRRLYYRHSVDGSLVLVVVAAILMLTAIVYVIKHNWTSTTIRANRDDGLTLTFRDPFSRRRYHLPSYGILQIAIVQSGPRAVNELLVLGQSIEMRIFTAHPWAELEHIRRLLTAATADDTIPLAELVD